MTDWKNHAQQLLDEFKLCQQAKPKHDAINIQLEKDTVAKWAYYTSYQLGWGKEADLAEACHQLEWRLKHLKEKLIVEILTNGSI
mgnify:CR=1 FL=1